MPERTGHRDGWVLQGLDERRDDIARRFHGPIEDDDDRRAGPADAGVQRGGRTQPSAEAHDLGLDPRRTRIPTVELGEDRGRVGGDRVVDDDDLRPVGRMLRERDDGPFDVLRPVRRDEDHRRHAHGCLVQARRDRAARAVPHDTVELEVRGMRRAQREVAALVHDRPARGLDLATQPVGRRPVPCASCLDAGLRGLEDLGRDRCAKGFRGGRHGSAGYGSSRETPRQPAAIAPETRIASDRM